MTILYNSGPFIPPWYENVTVSYADMSAISIFWGFSLCLSCFTAVKAARQTRSSYRRHRKVTTYVAMIWGHWITNVVPSIVTWLHFWGSIPSSFWLFFFTVIAWSIQVHLLMQIMINRISLLIHDRSLVLRLKWAAFVVVFLLTGSVCIVWIPASLQISPAWIDANRIWDRAKQAMLLVMDLALNIYFLYVVRKHLILNGLNKYSPLFYLNIAMVSVVTVLDGALIGLMSLPVGTAYLQFQEVAYLAKLYIELNNTDLIAKVAKATNQLHGIQGASDPQTETPTIMSVISQRRRQASNDKRNGKNHATVVQDLGVAESSKRRSSQVDPD